MGKQSARLYYQGKDHKEIYYNGHYHDRMYMGSQLVWEKLNGDLWEWFKTNYSFKGSIAYNNGKIFAAEHYTTGYSNRFCSSENGETWTTYDPGDLIYYEYYVVPFEDDFLTYTTYAGGEGHPLYRFNRGEFIPLKTHWYLSDGTEVNNSGGGTVRILNRKGILYATGVSIDSDLVKIGERYPYIFSSTDGIHWHCIGDRLVYRYVKPPHSSATMDGYYYYPPGISDVSLVNDSFYCSVSRLNFNSAGEQIETTIKIIKTNDFETVLEERTMPHGSNFAINSAYGDILRVSANGKETYSRGTIFGKAENAEDLVHGTGLESFALEYPAYSNGKISIYTVVDENKNSWILYCDCDGNCIDKQKIYSIYQRSSFVETEGYYMLLFGIIDPFNGYGTLKRKKEVT